MWPAGRRPRHAGRVRSPWLQFQQSFPDCQEGFGGGAVGRLNDHGDALVTAFADFGEQGDFAEEGHTLSRRLALQATPGTVAACGAVDRRAENLGSGRR